MKKKNLWPGSAVNFVTTAGVLVQNAKSNQVKLAEEDTTITPQALKNLDVRVQDIKNTFVGKDTKKTLRNSTATVKEIQDTSLTNLGSIKNIIETKIKGKPQQAELLNTLGFAAHFAKANKKNQQALTALLNHFSTNLTDDIRAQLEAAGAATTRIDDILNATTSFDTANINQEVSKGTPSQLSQEARTALNDLYTDVKAISNAGKRVFKDDSALKALFVITTIMKNIDGTNKAPKAKKDAPTK